MKQFVRKCIAHAVAKIPIGILTGVEHVDIFEKRGFHVTRDHFYQPIPNTAEIDPGMWDKSSEMIGVNPNISAQLALLGEISELGYLDEYHRFPITAPDPREYGRGAFGPIDGALLYGMIRKFQPARVIEIGAGRSTLCSRLALRANGDSGSLTAIDPYPQPYLKGRDGDDHFTLIESRVELVPVSLFESLEANDILFIDSSHVIRIGGDVLYEVLEVIPRLKVGSLIHIHDIFFPHHYPKQWTMERRMFWTEQYLIQAFLAFNKSFDIMWSSSMMETLCKNELLRHFSELGDSSLWLRRIA